MGDGRHPGLCQPVQVSADGVGGWTAKGWLRMGWVGQWGLPPSGELATTVVLQAQRFAPAAVHTTLHPHLLAPPRRHQINLSRSFQAAELEHVMAYSDGRDGLLADMHIVSAAGALMLWCRLGSLASCCFCIQLVVPAACSVCVPAPTVPCPNRSLPARIPVCPNRTQSDPSPATLPSSTHVPAGHHEGNQPQAGGAARRVAGAPGQQDQVPLAPPAQ